MSFDPIDLGSAANDGTGDSLRAGGQKLNTMLEELYTLVDQAADAAAAAVSSSLQRASNLSDLASASAARSNLGLGSAAVAAATAFLAVSANLGDLADAGAARSNLGLAIGTDVQAHHANLAQLAGLSLVADRLPYADGAGTLALATFTDAGRAMVGAASAAAQTALLDAFTGDSGSGGLKGLVPAPLTGDATKFLRGDGTWATVATGLTVGSTAVASGTDGRVLYNNNGTLGEKAVTGTGDVVLATSPTLVTPALGAASATSLSVSGALTLGTSGILVGGTNLVEQYNSTSAQTYSIYNTRTDGSNYERARMVWGANIFGVNVEGSGTGTQRGMLLNAATLTFQTATTNRWQIDGSGHLLASTDNTYDIGALGATRPRNLYLGANATIAGDITGSGNVRAGTSSFFSWSSRSVLAATADGQVRITGSSTTTFDSLLLGPSGTTYTRLKHGATGTLHLRLADDSAYAALGVSALTIAPGVGDHSTLAAAGDFNGELQFKDGAGHIRARLGMLTGQFDTAGGGYMVNGGSAATGLYATGLDLVAGNTISWRDGNFGTQDLFLYRGGAGILEQYNSTNAQRYNVYRTRTDGSNYERLAIYWSGVFAFIRGEAAGTGSSRNLVFGTSARPSILGLGGTADGDWNISNAGVMTGWGNLFFGTDNTYDIGASGATRPRTIWAGTDVNAGGNLGTGAGIIGTSQSAMDIYINSVGGLRVVSSGVAVGFGAGADSFVTRAAAGTVQAGTNASNALGAFRATRFQFVELSADPSDPAEGMATLWQSDGTGAGDDGDIMMKITAGGVTKTATVVDFSAIP